MASGGRGRCSASPVHDLSGSIVLGAAHCASRSQSRTLAFFKLPAIGTTAAKCQRARVRKSMLASVSTFDQFRATVCGIDNDKPQGHFMIRLTTSLAALAMALAVAPASAQAAPAAPAKVLTPQDADAFVASAEAQLAPLSVDVNRISWVNATFFTDDTDALAAQAGARQTKKQIQNPTKTTQNAHHPNLTSNTAPN